MAPKNGKLSAKHKLFIKEYLVDLNASAAAVRAGYSKRTANRQGHRLLINADIQAAIKEGIEARAKRTDITADRVLEEFARVGFSDIGDYVSWNPVTGVRVIDSKKLEEYKSRAIAEISEIKSISINAEGEETIRTNLKLKLHNKISALESLAKHLGILDGKKPEEAPDLSSQVNISELTDQQKWERIKRAAKGNSNG